MRWNEVDFEWNEAEGGVGGTPGDVPQMQIKPLQLPWMSDE